MRILFTRHGESEANVQRIISNRNLPHKLTQTGISQAFALAKRLVDSYDVRLIGASPILRAQETAAIVAESLGLSPATYPALREFDCGMMEGRGDSEAWAAHQAVVRAWDEEKDFDQCIEPDGESFNDIKERFLPFVARLIKENQVQSGDILLISHGAVLLQMLPLVVANVDRAFTKQNSIGKL
ncbi:histidine phosphatase family protein [Chloroflexi bacterium TSY]|nr:histidine phosphatase family protein [Chloroflexi bacterium TSY]